MNEYAMYKGENLLIIGTAKEIAEYAEIKKDVVFVGEKDMQKATKELVRFYKEEK